MIQYSNIGITKGIDLTNSKNSKGCRVYHYYYSNQGFKFQKLVGNCWNYFLMISIPINNIANIIIKGADYRCMIYGVSKSDAIHLLENFPLNDCWFI